MIEILDINDDRINIFSNLKNKKNLNNNKLIVESNKVVKKLLKSNLNIEMIFAYKEFIQEVSSYLPQKAEVYTASKTLLKQITGSEKHHGVFALAQMPSYTSIKKLSNQILILNGLTSPENVGSIVRSAAAFNLDSIIFDNKTVSPFSRRCVRVSMGNIFSMKIHSSNSLIETLKELKDLNYNIYSTANFPEAKLLSQYNFSEKSVVIIGSEGHGVDKEILDFSDEVLKIEINQNVAHLNAGHASAIFLYELMK